MDTRTRPGRELRELTEGINAQTQATLHGQIPARAFTILFYKGKLT